MKHVIFAMVKIAVVMENVQTTKMAIPVNVYHNTMDITVNKEITVTVTPVYMGSVQIVTMVSIVHV